MILKGKKVILRPLRLSDAPRFVRWLNDEAVYKFLEARNRHLTLPKEREWIRQNMKEWRFKKNFAIDTLDHVHIGSVSLDLSPRDRRAIFGIVIGDKKYWNRGFGTDAAKVIIDYGFKRLGLHRIELGVMVYNPRAIRVYKKLGFRLEGKKREHIFYKGKYRNLLQMAILDREWKEKF